MCILPAGSVRKTRSDICESVFLLSCQGSTLILVLWLVIFQEEPEQILAVAQAMISCTWFDAYAQMQSVHGRDLEATFSRKGWESLLPGPYRNKN